MTDKKKPDEEPDERDADKFVDTDTGHLRFVDPEEEDGGDDKPAKPPDKK